MNLEEEILQKEYQSLSSLKKKMVSELLENQTNAIVRSIRSALELSPPELAADISQDGIVLTGGGALLHCLDTLIEQSTGIPTRVSEDPLTCVARGGGIALGLMDKDFDLFAEE